MSPLPYRRCVGAALFARDGRVLMAHRADQPREAAGSWQMPQGGIDAGESPETAVLRELGEEIGTAQARLLGMHPDWLTYDLPEPLIGHALHGRYRGQRQRWFAFRFLGSDADIRLDADRHIEFDAWRWVDLADAPDLVVAFKQPIYRILAASFARFSVPEAT